MNTIAHPRNEHTIAKVIDNIIPEHPTKQIGNPQLGKAEVGGMLNIYGKNAIQLSICPDCGGYFFAMCPCWGRSK